MICFKKGFQIYEFTTFNFNPSDHKDNFKWQSKSIHITEKKKFHKILCFTYDEFSQFIYWIDDQKCLYRIHCNGKKIEKLGLLKFQNFVQDINISLWGLLISTTNRGNTETELYDMNGSHVETVLPWSVNETDGWCNFIIHTRENCGYYEM